MKNMKWAVLGVVLAGLLAGCSSNASASSNGAKKLTLSTFGLSTKQMTNDLIKPFETKNGVTVKTQFGDSTPRFTQVQHNPNAGVDVMELAQNNTLTGYKKNLWAKLDTSKLKNFKYLSSAQQKLAKQTNSVPYTVNSVGIIYNAKKVGKITSWDQLWSSKFRNKIAIPDISTTFGPAMLYIAGDHAGTAVTKDGGKAAFSALKALKPNVVKTYSQSSDLANMFKSGEIVAAVVGDYAVSMVQAAQPDAQYVVPASGTYANYDMVSIVKGTKNLKAAYKYIDYRIGKAAQTKAADPKVLNNAPVNTSVKLSAATSKYMTYGAIAKRAKTIDFGYVNSHLSKWVTTWNKIMNQ